MKKKVGESNGASSKQGPWAKLSRARKSEQSNETFQNFKLEISFDSDQSTVKCQRMMLVMVFDGLSQTVKCY